VAEDRRTRELLALASRVAKTDATVIVTGESGSGKEVFARYIHENSARKGGRSLRSIVRRFRRTCWRRCCSATRKARSRAHIRRVPANSNRPRRHAAAG